LASVLNAQPQPESNEYFGEVYRQSSAMASHGAGVPDVPGGYINAPFWNTRYKHLFSNNLTGLLPFALPHSETPINLVMRTLNGRKHFISLRLIADGTVR
jgi:hypothetical protein